MLEHKVNEILPQAEMERRRWLLKHYTKTYVQNAYHFGIHFDGIAFHQAIL